ncbi:MAG: multidrug efflux MFS transporter [SAR202 cluster bacterium]|nr:multidrug efflux MFS transporter [SAR202 cluster bacterium]
MQPIETAWRRNLATLWTAQVVSLLGWTLTFNFYPFFFRSIGVDDPARAAFWTGVSAWMFGLGLFVMGPIWGFLADRRGRKLNVLRATFIGGLVLLPVGFATQIWQIVVLRLIVGMAHGLDWATNGLIAATTPRAKLPLAFGIITTSLFAGSIFGPLLGGLVIDRWGMGVAFVVSGAAFIAGGALVWAFVHERFERPAAPTRNPIEDIVQVARMPGIWRLLVMLVALHSTLLLTSPVIAPLVSELHTGGNDGTATGLAFMANSIGMVVSSLASGWLSARLGLKRVFLAGSIATAVVYIAPFAAQNVVQFVLAFGLAGLVQGGLINALNGLIAMSAPAGKQGTVFGAAQAAIAVAVAVGPLVGGTLALWSGLRGPFALVIASFAVVTFVAWRLLQAPRPETATAEPEPMPAPSPVAPAPVTPRVA